VLRASNCCALIATLRAKLRPRASPALFELRDIPLDPTHDGRVSKLQSTFCHHLDEIPEAELITKVPTYTTGSPHDRSADPQTLPSFPSHYSYQHQAPQNNTVSEWGTRYLHQGPQFSKASRTYRQAPAYARAASARPRLCIVFLSQM
jgi:hypothetical protein